MNRLTRCGIISLKGFGMGIASVTPCVSAGTVALMTGIYDLFINTLNAFSHPKVWKALIAGHFRQFWRMINGTFFSALMFGLFVGILACAKLVSWGLAYYPILTWAFFFGLIIASMVRLLDGVEDKTPRDYMFAFIGMALGIGFFLITPSETPDGWFFLFICGMLTVCTMILPGIAGSVILQSLGKYETLMNALSFPDFDLGILLPFLLGSLAGILLLSKLVKWLMDRWGRQTTLILIGFVLGSLVRVWPYANLDSIMEAQALRTGVDVPVDYQVPAAILWFILGVCIVTAIHRAVARYRSR